MKTTPVRIIQAVSAIFLILVASVSLITYGITVGRFKTPPYALFERAYNEFEAARGQLGDLAVRMNVETTKLPLHYKKIAGKFPRSIYKQGAAQEGINLVTRITKNSELAVDIVDMEGSIIHSWNVDWFEVWPDADHIPEILRPQSKPGSHVHGAVVLDNGDLVYNYEHLGLVRISKDSEVIWRLPYRTHHSIHRHDDGMLWVSGQRLVTEPDPLYPHRKPPFDKYTILEIEPIDGAIVNEWDVADILHKNGYANLLDLVPVNSKGFSQVQDDRLHLNDIEPFPDTMEEGFFTKGDVLVSLRNVSTVFVFNRDTLKIKYITTGIFSQQHDPDFLDGNRFSVLDNNKKRLQSGIPPSSRIVIVTAPTSEIEVVYEGTPKRKFYTPFMGKHQWLPNGNILITESLSGRAFEVNSNGKIVWQFVNKIDDGIVALMEEVTRLPIGYAEFFPEQAPIGGQN